MVAPVKLWIHQEKPNEATDGLTFLVIKMLVKLHVGKTPKEQKEEQMVDFLSSDSK
jgi:hypothetical protein